MKTACDPQVALAFSRRELFQKSAMGLGGNALSSFLGNEANANPKGPHFAPRAKRVIFLHMTGGPSHVDLFDPKLVLNEYDGQQAPAEFINAKLEE